MRWITLMVVLVTTLTNAKAQKVKEDFTAPFRTNAAYRIGTELPDFGRLKLINSTEVTIALSDFKTQLLILDFWGPTCKSCIEGMPHMEALQKEFGNQIRVLPVTRADKAPIEKFWKENKYLKTLTIPSVVEGQALFNYFPSESVPHEVWIYKGKVIGITDYEFVDADNIKRVLKGEIPDWPVRNEFYEFDMEKRPLFKVDPNQLDTSSTFVKYAQVADYKEIDGLAVSSLCGRDGIVRNSKHKTVRTYLLNKSIYHAYIANWFNEGGDMSKLVVPPNIGMSANVIIWEVSDRSKYIYEQKPGTYEGEWMRKNGICFESLNPDSGQTDQQVYQWVSKDLDRLLGLRVRWEKRKEKVLVLVRTTKEDRLKSKVTGNPDERYKKTGNLYQYRGYYGIPVANIMNQQASNPYVFDETRYGNDKPINMDLNIPSWTDIQAIRKAIAPYGLGLKEEERLVDKFVFTEIDGGLMVDGAMQIAARTTRDQQKDMKNPTVDEGKAFIAANKLKPGVVTLPSGLQYKVIKTGTGVKPGANDQVKFHYTGTLVNGKIFDSSYESGVPLTSNNGMVRGVYEALKIMPVGSRWIIYLPSELAYGNDVMGAGELANQALIFEIEVLSIVK